jgi:oligopeptide/dipeptide ABC transporter ATP-binding protein
VDGASFSVRRGEAFALVGESGCGKTVTAMAVLNLLARLPSARARGQVLLEGRDLLACGEKAMRFVRGRKIGMVFQEPSVALNPVMTVGAQVAETLTAHGLAGRREARRRAVEMLGHVGLPDPERQAGRYPHQLSGGMQQRAVMAGALACGPALLVADEPTTALDVTVQAQILRLLDRLRRARGMALLLITHDLSVVSQVAERVAVMYAGRVVEQAPADDLFRNPAHPYTQGLLKAVPELAAAGSRLFAIPGRVPDAASLPAGCRFRPRCPLAKPRCAEDPPWVKRTDDHGALCWEVEGEKAS